MKKLFLLALATLTFVACEKSDPRDQFIGTYTFVETGSVDMYSGTQKAGNIPMDSYGNFVISKYGSGNSIRITGDLDAMTGNVSGNKISFQSNTSTSVQDGITIQTTFYYEDATLNGRLLKWETDVAVTASSASASIVGNGKLSMQATKN